MSQDPAGGLERPQYAGKKLKYYQRVNWNKNRHEYQDKTHSWKLYNRHLPRHRHHKGDRWLVIQHHYQTTKCHLPKISGKTASPWRMILRGLCVPETVRRVIRLPILYQRQQIKDRGIQRTEAFSDFPITSSGLITLSMVSSPTLTVIVIVSPLVRRLLSGPTTPSSRAFSALNLPRYRGPTIRYDIVGYEERGRSLVNRGSCLLNPLGKLPLGRR